MKFHSARRISLAVAGVLLASISFAAEGFLRTQGDRIVTGTGHPILLRGMGLGGWMLQEGYMLRLKGENPQHRIRSRIVELIGPEATERFYILWRDRHMTEADVRALARAQFNSIRLPMHYNLFTLPVDEEPDPNRHTWLPTGFEMIDRLLTWCRAYRIYLILDLHAAPGGQGHDVNICDRDTNKPSLWEDARNQAKTVALWRKLAERYAQEPWIGGYDLINEPNWSFEGRERHGREDQTNAPLWKLYQEITRAIREVDTNHLIILGGNGWGNNYRGFPGPWDSNMVLSFHKYWNPNTDETIAPYLALREKYRLPIWLGESGENSNEWFRECVALMERHHIGWAWWPHKKVASSSCVYTVQPPAEYQQLLEYWNGNGPRPTRETALRVLFTLTENLHPDRCHYNEAVVKALIPAFPATQ